MMVLNGSWAPMVADSEETPQATIVVFLANQQKICGNYSPPSSLRLNEVLSQPMDSNGHPKKLRLVSAQVWWKGPELEVMYVHRALIQTL
eukprot:10122871-Ditylum_brightwellii.AAC.1